MRIVLQRVSSASVTVDGTVVSSIGPGLLLLVGVSPDDGEAEVKAAAEKVAGLRVFPDERGQMNLSPGDTGAEILVISQFTLLASVRRGRRPSLDVAAPPELAEPVVAALAAALVDLGLVTRSGRFGERMMVSLVNEGPVTLVLDVERGRVT